MVDNGFAAHKQNVAGGLMPLSACILFAVCRTWITVLRVQRLHRLDIDSGLCRACRSFVCYSLGHERKCWFGMAWDRGRLSSVG